MNREQARKLIKDTFEESFDKNNFINFVVNLLNLKREDLEKTKKGPWQGNLIPEPFKHTIHKYERVTKYFAENNRIDILIVYLKRQTSIERARTKLRNFIAGYLKGNYGSDRRKDAALVAFVSPENQDWRFSLVKIDYSFKGPIAGKIKVNEEFTPAKRWSFLVGKNEKSHTAQSRFIPILMDDEYEPTLEDLEKAFNVEVVTDEFFQKYRDLFIKTKLELDKIVKQNPEVKQEFQTKNISTVDFTKKLLSQITFLYFLQKKGWFGVPDGKKWGEGNKTFIRDLFKKCGEDKGKYFFKDCLVPLFYDTLNNPRSNQADPSWSEHFNCKMPFLNGGLFESIYDWVNVKILIPNELFSNTNKTKEGDIGDGILDIFDRFNFTVNEEEPLEKEVALDPELLGKIYEKLNAIREDNFDEYVKVLKSGKKPEKAKFNKEYGVYYTPREIVHYMCQESLISYLKAEMKDKVSRDDLEEFVKIADSVTEIEAIALEKEEKIQAGDQKTTRYETQIPENIRSNAKELDQLLDEIKVLDPAVGSGAFLIGMMHEIVRLRKLLSIYLDKEVKIYNFKRSCIENSLYGVDIDNGAVEICKLRFWLSMIVDEEDFYNIKPLPNLDYKVVRGDSLLGFPENWDSSISREINNLMHLYFKETNPKRKKELKDDIDSKINSRLENSEKNFGYKIDFDFRLFFSEVFHQKGGFDVVIANPPYIQLQNEGGKLAKLYEKLNYETFTRKGDIYTLFHERGIQLLKENGLLCFITSNKWLRAGYGEKLRNFFAKYNPQILIDLGPGIFETATVDTNILLIQKKPNEKKLRAVTLQRENNEPIDIKAQLKEPGVILTDLTKDAWFIGSATEQKLKKKIEQIGKPLKEWDVKIYYGIKTGLNEAFIIDSQKREEILNNCKDTDERRRTEAIIKPILRGRDIKRYYYEWAGLWVIGTFPALRLNIDDYPSLKKYFLDHFDIRQLEQLGKKYPELGFNARKRTGNKWFEIQDQIAYYHEFEKEKVVWAETDQSLNTVIVPSKIYLQKTCFMIISNRPKIFNAFLNSIISQWYIRNLSSNLGTKGMSLTKKSVQNIPLPPITPSNKSIVQQIEESVDKIFSAKKENPHTDTGQWEQEIDRLVYMLYELTEKEIKIIENK